MSRQQSGTSVAPLDTPGLSGAALAGRRRRLLGTTEMETIRKGAPEEKEDLLADLRSEGEIVDAVEPDGRAALMDEDPDESVEMTDWPEDEDDLPTLLLTPDEKDRENEGVREALSFANASQEMASSEGVFTIAFTDSGARFIPPPWLPATRGVPVSTETRVKMYSLAEQFRFLAVWAEWFTSHRPRFVSTFDLRHWAPDSVAEVEALYAGVGPNCLQQSMVKLLRQAAPNLDLTESTMSRYLSRSVAVYRGRSTMLLADLFSSQAQAIWAAAAVTCFIRKHKLSPTSLDTAADNITRQPIRAAASRVGNDTRAMRLQDFILFVQKPLKRTVSVSAIITEARMLLMEGSQHA